VVQGYFISALGFQENIILALSEHLLRGGCAIGKNFDGKAGISNERRDFLHNFLVFFPPPSFGELVS
jgi:hypothetical protein